MDPFELEWHARFGPPHWLGDEEMYHNESSLCVCVPAPVSEALSSLPDYVQAASTPEPETDNLRNCRSGLKDVFSKRFCVFPINEYGSHWTMLAICTLDDSFIYADSLGSTLLGRKSQRIVDIAQRFLGTRLTRQDPGRFRMQTDGTSCGKFYMEYARAVERAAGSGATSVRSVLAV